VSGEFNAEDRIIARVCGPPGSPDLNPCDFYLRRKVNSVVYDNNSHDLEALKHNICGAIYSIQTTGNCNKFPEICLKEFRHVSQQRVDI
jgi:hypothetical protein